MLTIRFHCLNLRINSDDTFNMKHLLYLICFTILIVACDNYDLNNDNQNESFVKYYGGFSGNTGLKILDTGSGYLLVGIVTISGQGKQVAVINTDYQGNQAGNTKVYGYRYDEEITNAISDNTGNFYLTGSSYQPGSNLQAYVLKVNNHGDTLWTRRFGGANNDVIKDLELLNNELFLTGYFINDAGNTRSLISKWSTDGKQLNNYQVSSRENITINSVMLQNDILMGVGTILSSPANPENTDVIFMQINQAGTPYNTNYINFNEDERGLKIVYDQANAMCYVLAELSSETGEISPLVFRYDPNNGIVDNYFIYKVSNVSSINDLVVNGSQLLLLYNTETSNFGQTLVSQLFLDQQNYSTYAFGDASILKGASLLTTNDYTLILGSNIIEGYSTMVLLKLKPGFTL